MSRPLGTAAALERRRRRAVLLVRQGERRVPVARRRGMHYQTPARWLRQARPPDGRAAEPHTGPTSGLADAPLRPREEVLLPGSQAPGGQDHLWTTPRVAVLMQRHFGRDDHPAHVRTLRKRRRGWTSRAPRRQARERTDQEGARGLADDDPRMPRDASRRQAHRVLLDASGFFLTPTVRRPVAPRGQTPVREAGGRRDHVSAIRALTRSPVAGRPDRSLRLSSQTRRGEGVVQLWAAWRRRWGPRAVIGDRGTIPTQCGLVTAWLARHPAGVAADFRGSVPDLNPDAGGGGGTQYGRLAHLAANPWAWLGELVGDEWEAAQDRPALLRGFIRETGLPGALSAA